LRTFADQCSSLPLSLQWPKSIPTLGLAAALTAAAAVLAIGVYLAFSGLIYIQGVEHNVIHTVQTLSMGQPIYTPPDAPPFDMTQYSPLYYVLTAGVLRILDVSPLDGSTVAAVARCVSLICGLALVALLWTMMRLRMPAGPALAVCAFAVVVSAPWYFLARPDALTDLLILASIGATLAMATAGDRTAHAWAVAAAVAAVLALAAKQNGVQATMILFASILWLRRWRLLATAVITTLIIAGIAWHLTTTFLGGEVKANAIDGLDNGVDLAKAIKHCYGPVLSAHAFPIALILWSALVWLKPRRRRDDAVLAVSLVVLLAFASLTALKLGSAENYYNLFLIVGAFVVGLWWNAARRAGRRNRAWLMATNIVPLYLLLSLPASAMLLGGRRVIAVTAPGSLTVAAPLRYEARLPAVEWIRQRLAGHPEWRVLCLDVGGLVLLPDVCVAPQLDLCTIVYERGVVDYAQFREMVADGAVRYVLAGDSSLPPTFLGASMEAYRPVRRWGTITLFEYLGNDVRAATR